MILENKKVTVVGLGISGKAASILLKEKGAYVYAIDSDRSDKLKRISSELKSKGIDVSLGSYDEEVIKKSDLMVVSPSIKDDSALLKFAKNTSMPIVSEIELASWFCKAPIVAVTGTNGKSTIVTLIGKMLNESGKSAIVCGNIGDAFSGNVADIREDQVIVLEVSSFQLKRIDTFKPKISLITNITQNHFDWHSDFKDYFDSKKRIFKNQSKGDYTILNYDDSHLNTIGDQLASKGLFFSMNKEVEGSYYDDGKLVLNIDGKRLDICNTDSILLKGRHNIANSLAASLCSYLAGASIEGIKKALSSFKGLDHRFQYVADIEGVKFVDDSKATTVDACRIALSSCDGKVILIAGGRDKGSDFTKIKDIVKEKVKAVVLLGEANNKIATALGSVTEVHEARNMDDAVSKAQSVASANDVVLLSPMCASFDMYSSYKERGDLFKNAVRSLERIKI